MQDVHPSRLRHHIWYDVSGWTRRKQPLFRRSALGQVQPLAIDVPTPGAGPDRQLLPANDGHLPNLRRHVSLPRSHRPPAHPLHAQVPLAARAHHPVGDRLDNGTHIRQPFHCHMSAIPSAQSVYAVEGSSAGRRALRSDDTLQHSTVLRDAAETELSLQHRLRKRPLRSCCLPRSVSHTHCTERSTYTRDYTAGEPIGEFFRNPPADERRGGGTQHHCRHDGRGRPLPRLPNPCLHQPPTVLCPWP